MAKENGLGMTIMVDDSAGTPRDISNDITNPSWDQTSGVQDVTGIDKSAMEKLHLLADLSITLNGIFNDAANRAHSVLSNYRTLAANQVGRSVSIGISGQTLAVEVLFTGYSLNRAADGSFPFSAPGMLADGEVPVWS